MKQASYLVYLDVPKTQHTTNDIKIQVQKLTFVNTKNPNLYKYIGIYLKNNPTQKQPNLLKQLSILVPEFFVVCVFGTHQATSWLVKKNGSNFAEGQINLKRIQHIKIDNIYILAQLCSNSVGKYSTFRQYTFFQIGI